MIGNEGSSMKVIVIGGGIAGLSAGYYLQKKAHQQGLQLDLSLLEAGQDWGGKITTDRHEGFVIEGGPDTFLATKPAGVGLCRELGLEARLHGTNPDQRNTYVLHRGELEPLPDGLTMMIPTRFGPMIRTGLLSWLAKARMGLDFFLPPQPLNGDESLGAFISRRLGRDAYERLIEPLMSGIYAGDGDKLSLKSTFPYLREMELEYGGLVKGALAIRRKRAKSSGTKQKGSRSIFLTPRSGLAEIIEALVERLGDAGARLHTNAAVKRVTKLEDNYQVELMNGEVLPAAGVILATPAYVSGELLSGLNSQLGKDLQSIPYVSTATISLAYRESDLPRPLDGYGYVIPRREGRRALACTWTSTKFPHRAPDGYALVRVFVGRAGQEDDIPEDEAGLLAVAQEELLLTLGITAQPVYTRVYYWDKAMPQYNLGHPQRLVRIEAALEKLPGLALAGNGYRGIGIPDCIHSGEVAAGRVLDQLKEQIPQARYAVQSK
jgi:oxygen-dependent protoporphyrinogen oxidase